MKAYIIKNGKYIFDFDKDEYITIVTPTCLLPTRHLAEIILDNLLDGDGQVEKIDYESVDDRLRAYLDGYKQGRFDEQMHRNYE